MKIRKESAKRLINTLTPVLTRTDGLGEMASSVLQRTAHRDGGPGSGNWGHEGRPGKVGGSTEGGGAHNRITLLSGGKFSSSAKVRKERAMPHKITGLDHIPVGSRLTGLSGEWVVVKSDSGAMKSFFNKSTNENIEWNAFLSEHPTFGYVAPRSRMPSTHNVPKFKDGYFSAERMNKAYKANSGEQCDKILRKRSGELWNACDDDTKTAFTLYTGAVFHDLNGKLRSGEGTDNRAHQCRLIADTIEKAELPRDVKLFRGVNTSAASKFLKVDNIELINAIVNKDTDYLDKLVNKIRTDDGFMSCSSVSVDTIAQQAKVQFDIFAPKGTKGIYAEPFSDCGDGDGRQWDGKRKQKSFSDECETILQCGTSLQMLGYYFDRNNRLHFQCAIVSQNPKPIIQHWDSASS